MRHFFKTVLFRNIRNITILTKCIVEFLLYIYIIYIKWRNLEGSGFILDIGSMGEILAQMF